MPIIYHQLKNKSFYFPSWKVKHLFIGTFNPSGGDKVNYYYGRDMNQTWILLSKIFNETFNPNSPRVFFSCLKKHGIACVDMIDSVEVPQIRLRKINGEGYKDSQIINSEVRRKYNTGKIIKLIESNNDVSVYSTWGKGPKLKEWKVEVLKLGEITSLVSPSLAARVPKGVKKIDYMFKDWKRKIH